ncbi:MAG: sulfatase [Myxococcota bacterium]
MRARRWLLGALLASTVCIGAAAYWLGQHGGATDPHAVERIEPLRGDGQPRPNVILILLDTTRADHLGVYGHEPDSTPFLSELAKESVVFDWAFSVSSWTAPATASVFTGQYPWTHGIVDGFHWHQRQMEKAKVAGAPVMAINRLPLDQPTLAERFRALGYSTIGLASNINVGPEIGFDRGFDRFIRARADVLAGTAGALGALVEQVDDRVRSSLGVSGLRRPIGSASDFRARLEGWQEDLEAAEPYFIYLHLNDPHRPYVSRYPYVRPSRAVDDARQQRREDLRAKYLSEIEYVDAQIERIVRMGLHDDDTVLVVVSDHGEEFGDHGGMGHARGLHSELNRILMMVHGPDLGIEPARFDLNVSQIDILPTLLELVGADVPTRVEGRSLVPLLRPSEATEPLRDDLARRVLFAHRRGGGEWLAAMDGPWKLIRAGQDRLQLFDMDSDPNEKNDLSTVETETTEQMSALFAPFDEASFWNSAGVSTFEAGEALREQLRALGYVE